MLPIFLGLAANGACAAKQPCNALRARGCTPLRGTFKNGLAKPVPLPSPRPNSHFQTNGTAALSPAATAACGVERPLPRPDPKLECLGLPTLAEVSSVAPVATNLLQTTRIGVQHAGIILGRRPKSRHHIVLRGNKNPERKVQPKAA